MTVPIVPATILFDLLNGGDKDWAVNPYGDLGARALAAADADFELGTVGCGTGALTANLKGGLGSASLLLRTGHTVGALVGANGTGMATVGDRPNFWAAPFEMDAEFGGLGTFPDPVPFMETSRTKRDYESASPVANTTIAIVATDAALTKAQCKRLAVAAQDGIARAISPSHALVDGDIMFAVATGERPVTDPIVEVMHRRGQCAEPGYCAGDLSRRTGSGRSGADVARAVGVVLSQVPRPRGEDRLKIGLPRLDG